MTRCMRSMAGTITTTRRSMDRRDTHADQKGIDTSAFHARRSRVTCFELTSVSNPTSQRAIGIAARSIVHLPGNRCGHACLRARACSLPFSIPYSRSTTTDDLSVRRQSRRSILLHARSTAGNFFSSGRNVRQVIWRSMMKLDKFDVRIWEELQASGRTPTAQLAERVGLSSSPTLERVRRLGQARDREMFVNVGQRNL